VRGWGLVGADEGEAEGGKSGGGRGTDALIAFWAAFGCELVGWCAGEGGELLLDVVVVEW